MCRKSGSGSRLRLLFLAALLLLFSAGFCFSQDVESMTDEQIISELLSNLKQRETLLSERETALNSREQNLSELALYLQTREQQLSEAETSVDERLNLLNEIENSLKSYSAAVEGELLFWKIVTGVAVVGAIAALLLR